MTDEASSFLDGNQAALELALAKLTAFSHAIASLRAAFPGSIIVNVPPFPSTLRADALELSNPGGLGAFHRAIAGGLIDQVSKIDGVRLYDLDAL